MNEDGWCISCGGSPHLPALPGCLAQATHPQEKEERHVEADTGVSRIRGQ